MEVVSCNRLTTPLNSPTRMNCLRQTRSALYTDVSAAESLSVTDMRQRDMYPPAGRPVSPAGVSGCKKPDALLVRLWLTPSTSTMKHVRSAAAVRLLTANARPCTTRSHQLPGRLRHTE